MVYYFMTLFWDHGYTYKRSQPVLLNLKLGSGVRGSVYMIGGVYSRQDQY